MRRALPVLTTVAEAELLLAELIAEAESRDLRGTTGACFKDSSGNRCDARNAVSCCAMGAARLAGYTCITSKGLTTGNDLTYWHFHPKDRDLMESMR